jgi:purine-binding chemotaxis protein CheW
MSDKTEFADISILPRTLGLSEVEDTRERRELLVACCGERLIGVFADEAEQVTAWKQPSPLPGAPPAVLGAVSVRGRIYTLLEPLTIMGERQSASAASFAFIITLRGDEQLALAVERAERIMEIFADDVEPLGSSRSTGVVHGLLQTEGKLVAVLNVRELFATALSGTERRRKRNRDDFGLE